MPIILQHIDLTIEISDDHAFTRHVDSPKSYDKTIEAEEDTQYSPTSKHAIRIYRHKNLLTSAIILACGGGTAVEEDAAFVDDNNLIIRCCNKLFSLSLPQLEINWIVAVDRATCFFVYKYKDSYISHGEMAIARIDRTGKILWSFGGLDIFVCLDGRNAFEMHSDYMSIIDFNGSTYKIDFSGNTLEYKEEK